MEETAVQTSLDLVVSEFNLGTLESNARAILEAVKAKLQDYRIENYSSDNIAEAKRDKADLNTAAEKLNKQRLDYERKFMAPFEPFKNLVNETCAEIKKASATIDALVKSVEQQEKDEKCAQIEEYFATLNFSLFPLDRIFSPAWLNKTASMKSIQGDILARIEKTRSDLVVLDRLGEPAAKEHYLTTLNLESALAEADRLKANRECLQAAEEKRRRVEEAGPVEPEPEEPADEELPFTRAEEEGLSAQADYHDEAAQATANGITAGIEETVEYTLRVRAPWEKIKALRAYMDANKIIYQLL